MSVVVVVAAVFVVFVVVGGFVVFDSLVCHKMFNKR